MKKIICLAVVYGKNLLLVKKEGRWGLPREKLKVGELETECLFYRIIKEIPNLRLKDIMPLGKFSGRTLLRWSPIKDKIFIAKAESSFFNSHSENNGRIKWIKNLEEDGLSKSTRRIFSILKDEGCL